MQLTEELCRYLLILLVCNLFILTHLIEMGLFFFVIDFVHLIKSIRNNWLNQKNIDKCFFYPLFGEEPGASVGHNFYTASFSALRNLFDAEFDCLAKFGFKLSLKALNPSNFERQNVKLVLQIFNEFVPQGLLELGKLITLLIMKILPISSK